MNEIEKLRQSLSAIQARGNEILKGLPPLQQIEAGTELASGVSWLRGSIDDLERMIQNLNGNLDDLENVGAERMSALREEVKTELLDSGEYLTKTDAEAATETAVNAKLEELRQAGEEAKAKSELCSQRRGVIAKELELNDAVASAIPDDTLGAEDYETVGASVLKSRKAKLDELGIQAPAVLSETFSMPVEDGDDKAFEARCDSWKELADKFSAGVFRPAKEPMSAAGKPKAPKGEDETEASVVCL